MVIYVVANCLNERPSLSHIAKFGPGELHEPIRLAIAAAEQINERFDGKLFQSMLLSVKRHFVRLTVFADQKIGRQSKTTFWGVDNVADVAKTVAIAAGWGGRIQA